MSSVRWKWAAGDDDAAARRTRSRRVDALGDDLIDAARLDAREAPAWGGSHAVSPGAARAAGQWRVGDPIDMPDSRGNYPTFDTPRPRYWKNRAHFELQGRARGEGGDRIRTPWIRCAGCPTQTFKPTSSPATRPPDPRQPGRTMELEHSGVPQRVQAWLQELSFSAE